MADADFVRLDIGLYPHDDPKHYRVELSARAPHGDADIRPPGGPIVVEIDDVALGGMEIAADYGDALSRCLFDNAIVREFFVRARSIAADHDDAPLRIRLYVDGQVGRLHNLHWEKLRDPEHKAFLCHDTRILFSRYLSSDDWRDVRMRPQDQLRALVVVANPTPTNAKPLAPINVVGELERARQGLSALTQVRPDLALPVKALYRLPNSAGDPDYAGLPTFDNLVSQLRTGYDILYLACHGELTPTGPELYLETEVGAIDVMTPEEIVESGGARRPGLLTALRQLMVLPRLVILASCQSMGEGGQWADAGRPAVSALGYRLAEAGVPAVLAMQGDVMMSTVEQFMPEFFKELGRTGQIDAAVASARATVNAREDWWSPVLSMRLESGRIGWYRPQMSSTNAQAAYLAWDGLVAAVRQRRIMPIVGPGLIQFLMGSPQELAERWASTGQPGPYPLTRGRDSLPLVTRYLATMQQNPAYPADQLKQFLRGEIRRRHQDRIGDAPQNASLRELMQRVGETVRATNGELDAYRILARLPADIYITTMPDDLLYESLKEAGKEPQRALFQWKDQLNQIDEESEFSKPHQERNYTPTETKPLVYHIFGHIGQDESLVLTEDDYFQYLLAVGKDSAKGDAAKIPPEISRGWTVKALLFMGFQIDDWALRVLLHSIRASIKSRFDGRPRSVAVQISPDDNMSLNPEQATRFLERYLGDFSPMPMNVYWGSTQDLLSQLWQTREQWVQKD